MDAFTVSCVIFTLLTFFNTLNGSMSTMECPATSPCVCNGNYIDCASRNLSEVPLFNISIRSDWNVDLSFNNIMNIQSKAFLNIKGLKLLQISNNQITDIADDALYGTENTLDILYMTNNRMKKIPTALGMMNKISTIVIDGNPLQDFQENVFQNVSSSLQFLTFGHHGMSFWPDSLRYLSSLMWLTVRDLTMDYLPLSAFSGLEKSLGFLVLERCTILSLPLTLSTLDGLQELSLISNPNLQLSGVPGEAFSGIKSLTKISITNQNFDTVPDIFHDALTLRTMETTGTPITHIDASVIPDNTNLQNIRLSDTSLDIVPPAIIKIKKLQSLNIVNSSITSVSGSDFKGLTMLTSIGIIDAPLHFFSDDALRDTTNLLFLFLGHTNLTSIPKAIKGIKHLRFVDLEGSRIICTCSSLGWLKNRKGYDYLSPVGVCDNLQNVSIAAYCRDEVPRCPDDNLIS